MGWSPTRHHLVRNAKEEGLFVIQRLFITDTMSVETGKHLLKQSKADAVEVMPGIAPAWVYEELRRKRVTSHRGRGVAKAARGCDPGLAKRCQRRLS